MKKILIVLFMTISNVSTAESFNKGSVLDEAAKVIRSQFYSQPVGEKLSAHMQTGEFREKFFLIDDKQAFANQVSKELRHYSGDNHIGLVYSPSDVKRYRLRQEAEKDANKQKQNAQNRQEEIKESRLVNFGIQQLRLLEGNVGYLEMSYFDGFVEESAPVFKSAMDFLASAEVIILDLRRNGGGNSRILPLFLGYFLGPDKVNFADKIERWKNSTTKLFTDDEVTGARHVDKPIYILTSGTTFSLAEHVTYHLRAFDRATVVGERTYGGGKAFDPVVLNDDYYLRLPRIEMINTKTKQMYNEGEGITPDVSTSAQQAFDTAYLLAVKQLERQSKTDNLKHYYQWVERLVSARLNPPTPTELPIELTNSRQFDEFQFQWRNDRLWMSFRNLPWVELVNLGNGYFYDDRSIQRQFSFSQIDGHTVINVYRPMMATLTINEQ